MHRGVGEAPSTKQPSFLDHFGGGSAVKSHDGGGMAFSPLSEGVSSDYSASSEEEALGAEETMILGPLLLVLVPTTESPLPQPCIRPGTCATKCFWGGGPCQVEYYSIISFYPRLRNLHFFTFFMF